MRRAVDTRAALLGAAAGLLEGHGMAAVTLRAVGERAGVSRQAPYKHFADKEELLSVVAAGYFDRVGGEVAEAAGAAGGGLQEAGELPGDDPVKLAALMYATAHGAVDLALSGHTDEAKGLGDPLSLVRLL